MKDHWNAFVDSNLNIKPLGVGPLNGLTFAVKDVFEIKDYANTAGNPDWYRTHFPASRNAPVVDALLQQGAFFIGTTHTDELMYSLNGENFHYGTPVNPHAHNRIPGGSSSGSAVTTASRLVDFALGTDTGGSVRIPSSYCGLFGFRPTHGFVNIDGVIPLAKSFDTVGWMARDSETLLKIGEALLQPVDSHPCSFAHFYFEGEAWELVEEDTKLCLLKAASVLQNRSSDMHWIKIANDGLAEWANLFRIIQGIEIWNEHGEWIEKENPGFGPGIKERFAWASTLNKNELQPKMEEKAKINKQLSNLLRENGLLVIPTAPGEAPLKNLPVAEMEQYRSKTMMLTCIAGLSRFPQVTIPVMKENGVPIGLSFIANQYEDLKLLKWVNETFKVREQ